MKTLAFYALEVLVCSGVLLAAYAILLERRVRFRWCRAYLLAITPLAAVIPLLRIPVWPGGVIEVVPTVDMPQEWTADVVEMAAPTVTPETACLAIYLLGAVLIAGMMLWQVLCIRRLRRSAGVTRTDRFTLVRTPQRIASFSFFRTIYVWEQTPPGELQAIIAHEASHIAHRHSVERIGMECMKALLWWNPFVWITARRLTEAEEFEADSDVLDNGFDIEHYMNAIFKQMFGYSPEIANSLRDSLTKKRFKMMTIKTKSRHALLRLAGTLPAVIGLLCAFSFTTRAAVIRTGDGKGTPWFRSVYTLNGKEVPVDKIREIDPEQLQGPETASGDELPEAYKGRNIDFLFAYTTDGTPRKGRQITIEGRAIYPDGRPAENIDLYAGTTFTEPSSEAEMRKVGFRTRADGRFRIKGPTKGSLTYRHENFFAGTAPYDSKGANPFLQDIEVPFPDSTKWESARNDKGEIILLPVLKKEAEEGPHILRLSAPSAPGKADEVALKNVTLRIVLANRDKDDFHIGGPAVGAIVQIAGTTKGVVADSKGTARIEAPQGAVLEIIYPDYKPATVLAGVQENSFVILYPEGYETSKDGAIYTRDKDGVKQYPLYIVDGVEQPAISDLDGNDIDNISILRDEASTALYGPRGKNGVVIITTKRTAKPAKDNAAFDSATATLRTADPDTEEAFLVVETMPSFRGGDLNAFRAWVQENLRYPAEAIAKNIQGRVILSFVIEKDGSVSNVQLLQSPHQSLSDEARRIVESSPKWTPGEQRGQIVRVKFTLPVDFRMGQTTDKSAEKSPAGEPFIIAEQMPKFQNGDLNTFRAWVQQRVRYPSEAMAQKLYGRVVASFVIGKDGSVGDIRVLESPGKVLSDEVRRVIASSPNWEPGMQRGEKVVVKYTLPIDFAIQTDEAILRDKSASEVKGDIDEIMVIGFGGAAKTDKNQQPKPTADAGRTKTDDSRAVSLAERFGSEYGALIAQKKVAIGMDRKMCREALGEPTNSSKVTGQGKITEVWFYRNAQITLDFAGDRLVRWAGTPASRKHLARK